MTKMFINGTTAAAEAIAEDLRRQGIDVVVISDARVQRALELLVATAPAERATGRPVAPRGSPTALAEYEPRAEFVDWRNDVLSLTSSPGATYIGWLNSDGEHKVGVLRCSVLSPLPLPPEAGVSWGDCGAGAYALAQALVADALGPELLAREDLVESFVKEVVDPMPPEGFELSGDHLQSWFCGTGA